MFKAFHLLIWSVTLSCVLGFGIGACGGSGGKNNGMPGCTTGFEGCACYGNNTCEAGLSCASKLCVNLGTAGAGGVSPGTAGAGGVSPGTAGAGGVSPGTAGAGGVAVGSGGSTGGAAGATTAAGGAAASMGGTTGGPGGATAGSGGAAPCSCSGAQECTTDGHCVDPKVIDDFADCNMTINQVRGRNGGWYASADVGINVSFAVSTPPSGYSDRRCGAWTTGGPTGNGTTNYGILGVSLIAGGSPADLSAYGGIAVSLEAQAVDFVVKTTNGGYFTKRLTRTSGTQTFMINFADLTPRADSMVSTLNRANITDFQFAVIDPSTGYGFVVHALTLF